MVLYNHCIIISLLISGVFKVAQGDNHGSCCKVKRITAPDGFVMTFTLVETSAAAAPSICKNNCAYEMAGNPGRKFCFAPSNIFKSQCIQSSTSDFSKVQCGRIREGGCLNPMGGHGRIIGGQEADCNKYPWMAVVLADIGIPPPAPGLPPPKFPVGGATLINSRHVISAAHVGVNLETLEEYEERDLLVLVGKHDMTQVDPAEMAFEVERKITHPDYDFFRGANDIMILRLRYEVNLHIYTPVCMPPPSVASSTELVGEKVTLTGFGAISWPTTEDGQPILPRKLQELDDSLTVASSEGCLGWFEQQIELDTNMTAQNINTLSERLGALQDGNMFCASSEEGISACVGDSGSPLTYQVDPQVYELLGVVSWGQGPCKDTYTVFANVPYLHNWIVSEAGEVFYFNL